MHIFNLITFYVMEYLANYLMFNKDIKQRKSH